jgi:hypothetical protein
MADTVVIPNAQPSAPVEGVAPQIPSAAAPQTPDPKIEAIIRREKQLYRQLKEIKAREEALKAKESQWKPDEYVPKKRFQDDPLAALQELGLDYNKLTERALQEPNANDPTIRALLAKVNSLEERLGQSATQQQQAQEQQYEQVKSQMLADAQSFTSGSPDYELVDKYGAHDMVVAEIEKEFNRTQAEMGRGIVISMDTAAKRVEEYLMNETVKALEFNKIKNYKKPVAADTAASQEQQTQQDPNKLKYVSKKTLPYKVDSVRTLTNTMTQDAPTRKKDLFEDRRQELIARLEGRKV